MVTTYVGNSLLGLKEHTSPAITFIKSDILCYPLILLNLTPNIFRMYTDPAPADNKVTFIK